MYQQLHDPAFLAVASGGTPALDLFFSATKTLDSRITFTRGSSATYIDSTGALQTAGSGVARFTHDPVTLQSLGLLIEESRTNLLLRSEEFDNAYWLKQAGISIVANATAAPDATMSADLISGFNSFAGDRIQSSNVACAALTSYTGSIWVRATGVNIGRRVRLFVKRVDGTFAGSMSEITLTGSWQRVSATFTTAANNTSIILGFDTAISSGVVAAEFFVWGAQLEAGAFATSYIPTTSATVTRAADVATMTGTNFSSWFNSTEGTFAFDFGVPASIAGAKLVYRLGDSTGSASIGPYVNNTNSVVVDKSGTGTLFTQSGTWTGSGKHSLAYNASGISGSLNGNAVGSSAVTILATSDRLRLGSEIATSSNMLNGTIARIRYYRRRLPNANLQTLTT